MTTCDITLGYWCVTSWCHSLRSLTHPHSLTLNWPPSLPPSLHFTSLHFTSLHSTPLHSTPLHSLKLLNISGFKLAQKLREKFVLSPRKIRRCFKLNLIIVYMYTCKLFPMSSSSLMPVFMSQFFIAQLGYIIIYINYKSSSGVRFLWPVYGWKTTLNTRQFFFFIFFIFFLYLFWPYVDLWLCHVQTFWENWLLLLSL